MNKKIIFSLYLLFALASCQCPNGFNYASPEDESFILPEANKYYQVAMVCTDSGNFVTGIFKRNTSQVVCAQQSHDGYFADVCNGDGNKICCVSQTEYDTSILDFNESTQIANEGGEYSIFNEGNWFGLVEYISQNGDANYKYMIGGPWNCDNDNFGDPDVGYPKTCNLISTKHPLFNNNYTTLVASEGNSMKTIDYSSTEPVWIGYGAQGKFEARSMMLKTDDYDCDNNMFGDVNYGVYKECYTYQSTYIAIQTPEGQWQNVASGQDFTQTISWSTSYTNSVTQTDTLSLSISDTIKEGCLFASDELTITASITSSTAYTDTISHSETETCSATCTGDKVQYLWQWNIGGDMDTPEQIKNGYKSQTCNYVCTDTAEAPKCAYAMKWNEVLGECVDDI